MPTKDEMLCALESKGIEVPVTASIPQIRNMFSENVLQLTSAEAVATTSRGEICPPSSTAIAATTTTAVATVAANCASTILKGDNDTDSATILSASVACAPIALNNENSSSLPANADNENELNEMRRRLELLELRQRVQTLEYQSGKFSASDLKLDGIIEPFTGDDASKCIIEWLDELDHHFSLCRVQDSDKFFYVYRLLKGSAAMVAKASRASTLQQLKDELVANFYVTPTTEGVYRQLRNRRLSPHETALRYVLDMQRIASRASVPEPELINIIFEGLGSPSHTAGMRFLVEKVEDLKPLLNKFEAIRPRYVAKSSETPFPSDRKRVTTNRGTTPTTVRCFNCSQFGHHQSACTRQRRPPGACFRCFQLGHNYKSCPNAETSAAAYPDAANRVDIDNAETLPLNELHEVAQ
ncbi:uncharacterized protein LOC133393627 [Anopheles gambiae]|uniref:uncharacterized protein LOC133393627 n=1 Tax=Anopheles gambiae TaxID=7165 RepID=UPI002AC9DC7A|nr:uncharacterized protein LOC133393627 [Anopheles gambiae]